VPYVTPRPSVEKGMSAPVPHQRARWAYLYGSDVCENPYEPNTAEALAWTANWFQEKQDLEESVLALCHERGRLGK
jgi:hypothetical protein